MLCPHCFTELVTDYYFDIDYGYKHEDFCINCGIYIHPYDEVFESRLFIHTELINKMTERKKVKNVNK